MRAKRTPPAAVSQPDDERKLGTKAFLPVDTRPNERHLLELGGFLLKTYYKNVVRQL